MGSRVQYVIVTTLPTMIVMIVYSLLPSLSYSSHSCHYSSPLGMESGTILDYQVSASSSFASSVGPAMGRLHSAEGGGAWCPANMVTNNTKEWLEVDLEKKMIITAISLQGRWDNGLGQEFSPYIVLMYYDDFTHQFIAYSDKPDGDDDVDDYVMTGNTDTYSVVKVVLDTPVVTDKIRVIPFSYYPRTVCIRVELHGCNQELQQQHDERDLQHQQDEPDQNLTIWTLIPGLIGILLTCSILILVMTSTMYCKMNRRSKTQDVKQESKNCSGVLKSDWYLQSPCQAYQDPTQNNTADDKKQPEINDQFFVSEVSTEDPIYANPIDSTTSSECSPQSTLSSISTIIYSLEESEVDSSTATSYIPDGWHHTSTVSYDSEDIYTFSHIYKPSSSQEHIYSNIL